MFGLKRGFARATAVVSIAALVLVGCASPRATYITANDPCSPIREPFVQIKERQQEQIGEWAKAGAAAGAVAGGAIGAAAGNRGLAGILVGALGGAIVGGIAGATMGYYANKQERGLQTVALRNAVFEDAAADVRTNDRLVVAVADLNACRLQAVQQVATDFQAGLVSRDQAQERLNVIKAAAAADNELIDSILEGLERRGDIYVDAVKKSGAQDADSYLKSVETYRPTVETPVYTVGRVRDMEHLAVATPVLAEARAGAAVQTTLEPGTTVEVVRRQGAWTLVDYGSGQGYIGGASKPSDRAPSAAASVAAKPAPAPAVKPAVKGVSVSLDTRPKADNAIQELEVSRRDLEALKQAHVASVNRSIADTEALLL